MSGVKLTGREKQQNSNERCVCGCGTTWVSTILSLDFSHMKPRAWGPVGGAAEHPVGRLNSPCCDLRREGLANANGYNPAALLYFESCLYNFFFFFFLNARRARQQFSQPRLWDQKVFCWSLQADGMAKHEISGGSSGTWRRHWGERESTGPCKQTGHGANPQHAGCHAHFVQVSRLQLDAAATLGKPNSYRRHTREGKEASNQFNSKHTTVEWTETLWSASFKQIAIRIDRLSYIMSCHFMSTYKLNMMPVANIRLQVKLNNLITGVCRVSVLVLCEPQNKPAPCRASCVVLNSTTTGTCKNVNR